MKINALKNNKNVTLVLGTKHYQFTGDKAEKVFSLAQQFKKNKTEENLQALQNEIAKINVILHEGIIEEDGNGNFYLKGYRGVEMPESLAEQIIEYAENDYPIEALVNFWKLCMANPNTQARDDFFDYVKEYGVTITDKGYVVLYKSVARKSEANDELVNAVSQNYTKVKRWKKAPSKYAIVPNEELPSDYNGELGEEYTLVNCYEFDGKAEDYPGAVGNLQDLHDNIDELIDETEAYYEPHHSGGDYGNKIQLGEPVPMPREECDPNINKGCSVGLHVGHRSYVKDFNYGNKKLILACLVNPMNVVALPKHDNSKMRTCEYFPYAVMAIGREEWEEIEGGYFEEDYCDYEQEHIEELLENLEAPEEVAEEENTEECRQRLVDFYSEETEDAETEPVREDELY